MNNLVARVFCPECGSVRICLHAKPYAVCPQGHGKLVRRFTKADVRRAIASRLPRAYRLSRSRFYIEGHDGEFCYRDGSGRKPVAPGEATEADEVIARQVVGKRQLVRRFARRNPARRGTGRVDEKP